MGQYEAWNPLLYAVNTSSRKSIDLFTKAVNTVFGKSKLEIAELTPQHEGGLAWMVSDASPTIRYDDNERMTKQRKEVSDALSGGDKKFVDFISGRGGYSWHNFFGNSVEVSDDKLVVSFRTPGISKDTVEQLKRVCVELGFAQSEHYIMDDASNPIPHDYMSANLQRDRERVAGRLVYQSQYRNLKQEAIWFSTNKGYNGHWLYGADDVLVELRVAQDQPFMKLGQTVAEMGYILSKFEIPDKKDTFLNLWHSVVSDLIDPGLVTNDRLPSQQAIFDHLLFHTILPYLNPDYAQVNNFRPYNSMIFGSKGVGKTMLAAMLAVEKFDGGIVMPMSQEVLLNDVHSLFPRMKVAYDRTRILFIPLIEDLDKIMSLPSMSENSGQGIANSNLSNLLAGMGKGNLVIIGTGNNPEIIDPNFLEPERLGGSMLYLRLPDNEEREILIRNQLKKRRVDDNALDDIVNQLVRGSENFSQRMIVDVIRRTVPYAAKHRMGESPDPKHFQSISEEISQIEIQEALRYARKYYNFEHLKANEAQIHNFFKKLGIEGRASSPEKS